MRSLSTPAAHSRDVANCLPAYVVAGSISDYCVQSGPRRGVELVKGGKSSCEVTGSAFPVGGTRLKPAVLLLEVVELLLQGDLVRASGGLGPPSRVRRRNRGTGSWIYVPMCKCGPGHARLPPPGKDVWGAGGRPPDSTVSHLSSIAARSPEIKRFGWLYAKEHVR